MKVGDYNIPQVTHFKYLGLVIQNDGEIEGDANYRIQIEWLNGGNFLGILRVTKLPLKLKIFLSYCGKTCGVARDIMLAN